MGDEDGVGRMVAACDRCGAASEIAYGFVPSRPGTLCSPCWERRRVGFYAAIALLPVLLPLLAGRSPWWWWLAVHPLLLLAVGIHEAGHALMGRLVGFRVFEVQVGTGPKLAVFHLLGSRVELRAAPLCGFTSWAPTAVEGYGWRLSAAVAAGPAANLAAMAGALLLWPARWAFALAAVNAWLALHNLVPRRGSSLAGRSGNDGAVLCRPRRSPAEAAAALALAPYWESVVRWKDGDHLGARRVAEDALACHPGWVSAQDVLASALIGLGRYQEAREVLLAVLDAPDPPDGLRATALLSLAWADLCSGDPELLAEADAASRAAVRLLPWLAAARTARALALVERGDPAAALALVPSPWRGGLDRRQRASAAAVRARSLARLGQRQRSRRHLAWAAWLDPRCPFLAPA